MEIKIMKKIANKNGGEYTANCTEFNGNNTFARWENSAYVVYSYGYHFPMYVWKNSGWFENSDKYSVSTSKQQTQLRPHINLETDRLIGCTCPHECTHEKINYLNTSEMKNLINQ